jgi:hypothetical protein
MIYFKKLFFPTTISIIFSIGYYLGLYINSEIDNLKILLFKTSEKLQLMNNKYDLLYNEITHLKNTIADKPCLIEDLKPISVDCECQTVDENIKVIINGKVFEEEHDYEILDGNSTSPDIKLKTRRNSVTDILTKFF